MAAVDGGGCPLIPFPHKTMSWNFALRSNEVQISDLICSMHARTHTYTRKAHARMRTCTYTYCKHHLPRSTRTHTHTHTYTNTHTHTQRKPEMSYPFVCHLQVTRQSIRKQQHFLHLQACSAAITMSVNYFQFQTLTSLPDKRNGKIPTWRRSFRAVWDSFRLAKRQFAD